MRNPMNQQIPNRPCELDVMAVLSQRGPLTIPELYSALPQYAIGDCVIDAAIQSLARAEFISSHHGRRPIDGWGNCLLWCRG